MLNEFQEIPRQLSERKESFKDSQHPVIEIFTYFVNSIDGTTFEWTDKPGEDNFTLIAERNVYSPRPRGTVLRRWNEYFQKYFPEKVTRSEALVKGKANFPQEFTQLVDISKPDVDGDKVTNTSLGALPLERQTLKVELRRGRFTLRDIPALVKELESIHNRLATENIAKDSKIRGTEWTGGYIVDIAQRIGSEYMYWAKQLEEA